MSDDDSLYSNWNLIQSKLTSFLFDLVLVLGLGKVYSLLI